MSIIFIFKKCMYFCVIWQESEWKNKNSTVQQICLILQKHLLTSTAPYRCCAALLFISNTWILILVWSGLWVSWYVDRMGQMGHTHKKTTKNMMTCRVAQLKTHTIPKPSLNFVHVFVWTRTVQVDWNSSDVSHLWIQRLHHVGPRAEHYWTWPKQVLL